jgi:hypothetical protein
MAKNKNLIRKNVYIPEFVNVWLNQEAEKRGLSQSNVISLALQEVMKQEKAIDSISNMDKLIKELKKLKEE